MRLVRLLCLASAAVSLSGCINSSTLIKVKADGSGTIEQTVLMNAAALKSVMTGLDAQGQVKQRGPLGEAEMKKAAEGLGKGVRFVSSTPMSAGGFEGTKAIFAFDDVSELRVSQDPNVGASMGGQPSTSQKSSVNFTFARQATSSLLTVAFDEKPADTGPPGMPGGPDAVDPAMLQMMKSMFQGFKVAIDLEVDGVIIKTNADYVSGARITLMEIEMAALLEDEAKLRGLQGKIGTSIADIRPFLKDIKGVKINQPVVTVEYR